MIVTLQPRAETSVKAEPEVFELPPDKSILHRLLIIGAITQTHFRIPTGHSSELSHDIIATILALESLGVPVEMFDDRIELQGVGLNGLRAPSHMLHCANSGTTARLLMGLLAGQPFESTLIGDESLSRRPMARLGDLLNVRMNASVGTSASGTLPAQIVGGGLHSNGLIELPVASAQMKSAVLLAGIYANQTSLLEPSQSRDHTEQMLSSFGYPLAENDDGSLTIDARGQFALPDEVVYHVPGDISSAAFLIVAAILAERTITIHNVGLNPTRTRFLDMLTLMGVEVALSDIREVWGEELGTITIEGTQRRPLQPIDIGREDAVMLIDELPILSTLTIFIDGESTIHGAEELRVKESDRISSLVKQMREVGAKIDEHADGMTIYGDPNLRLRGGSLSTCGDHRVAMSLAVAAIRADEPVILSDAEIIAVSYPKFFSDFARLTEGILELESSDRFSAY